MSERLTLQDVIDQLSDKQEITKKDAETFLRELVALISETIEGKDFVRIKDFGTFKLTPVSARRSVDVNTGDPIEIPAHYRLSFVPDKVLREGVNKPFSHFESIEIQDDELSFEDKVDAPKAKAEIKKVEPKKAEAKKEVAPKKEEPKAVVEKAKVDEPVVAKKAEKAAAEVAGLENEKISASDLEREAELADLSSFIAKDTKKEDNKAVVEPRTNRQVVAKESTPVAARQRPVARQYDDEDDEYDDYEQILASQKKKRNIWMAVGVAILIVFGVGIWAYDNATYEPEAIPIAQNNAKVKITEEDTPSAVANEETDVVKVSQPEDTLVEDVQEVTPPVAAKEPETGSFEIVVQPKETMRVLGLKHLGAEPFWVYIFEENRDKISKPDAVFAGMKLTIPAKSKYGIDPKDKASLDKARRQEMKLFGQFSDK